MAPQPLIIHERLARWSRQLRPRFRGWSIRWAETRSADSLVEAAARSACPVVVLDLGDRPARSLEDLDALRLASPGALSLVLDPGSHPEVPALARELGATLVLPGVVVPPEVEALLRRWLPLAARRDEAEGWSPLPDPEVNPWDPPELLAPRSPLPTGL